MSGRRCALMDLLPLDEAPGWWRCATCSVTVNEHTHVAYDNQGRPVRWPVKP